MSLVEKAFSQPPFTFSQGQLRKPEGERARETHLLQTTTKENGKKLRLQVIVFRAYS